MNATPLGTDSCLNEGAEMTGNDPTEDEPSTLDNGALSEMTKALSSAVFSKCNHPAHTPEPA
jgi:hypothetical protein